MAKIYSHSSDAIDAITSSIIGGGVVIFPTETIYALACDAANTEAVKRVYEIKSRHNEMPLSLLVRDIGMILQYVDLDCQGIALIENFSPGPITYVFDVDNMRNLVPQISKNHSIGFRIPDHNIALEILRLVNRPVVGTSVNISGEPAAMKLNQISSQILSQVDVAIHDDFGHGINSSVVKIDRNGSMELLRDGAIPISDLQNFLKK